MVADLGRESPTLVAATVDAIIPGLSDAGDSVRVSSAAALAPFGPLARQAAPALVLLLETSKGENGRRAAVITLAAMGPGVPGVMPALARALRDDYPRVSIPAREALESISTPEAKEILAQWHRGEPYVDAGRSDRPSTVRNDPVTSDVVKSPDAARDPAQERQQTEAEAAVQVLKSRDVVVYLNGVTALQSMGPSVVPPLLELLRDGDGQARAGAASALSPEHRQSDAALTERTVAALSQALDDAMPRVRQNAAESLMKFGPRGRDAVPALTKLLGDGNGDVRDMAARALAAIGPDAAAAVPGLLKALHESNRPDRWIRHALERIGTEPARQGLADYDRTADPRK